MLDGLLHRGIESVRPVVADVLRLGAYQLLEMGSVPPYAAVSQSVELVRAAREPGAAGLVNGVLQSLRRGDRVPEFPSFEEDAPACLATWGSHPRWLIDRWIEQFGPTGARELVEANNRRPQLYLRPLGVSVPAAMETLREADIGCEPVPFAPDALRLEPGADVDDVLARVPGVIQDPAAGLVVRYAAVPPGATVADLCAAPGGKALALQARVGIPAAGGHRPGSGLKEEGAMPESIAAGISEDDGFVLAGDLSEERLVRVRENARRVRLPAVPVVADARRPPIRPVDAVLIDAPCTGTGTFRRHPDGKWRLDERDLDSLTLLQREILEGVADRVAVGGLLIYATCSLEPEENEAQVESFLERHPAYVLEPGPRPSGVAGNDDGFLRVLPQEFGVDGAFAARLRRNG